MKVLVTGGAGFIGSNIVDRLIEEGFDTVVIDDLSTGIKKNVNSKAKFYEQDIRNSDIKYIFQKEKPDYVSHHAAQKDVRLSVSDPIYDATINILGTINVLQNCLKYKVKKIVFASTGGAIYGEQDIFPAPETHPAKPISPYGITKLVAEQYMYYYKTVYGLDYVSLRYSNVYGPRQDPSGEAGVVAIFIQKMLNGDQPVIYGNGEQTRDFVYVGDIVKANLAALNNQTRECIFNIGTGVETSINHLFDYVKAIVNPSLKHKYRPAKEGEQLRSVIECSRAKEVLDWVPHTSLIHGLNETCNYFRENGSGAYKTG